MKIRVKDLWMVRTAVERLIHAKVPKETAIALSEMVERLNDEMTDYQVSRKRAWDKLGLNKQVPRWRIWVNRKKLVEQFNDEVAALADVEVQLPPPVDISGLAGLTMSTVDLVALKNLGVFRA